MRITYFASQVIDHWQYDLDDVDAWEVIALATHLNHKDLADVVALHLKATRCPIYKKKIIIIYFNNKTPLIKNMLNAINVLNLNIWV